MLLPATFIVNISRAFLAFKRSRNQLAKKAYSRFQMLIYKIVLTYSHLFLKIPPLSFKKLSLFISGVFGLEKIRVQ